MNEANMALLQSRFNFIWESCIRDSQGVDRPLKEQVDKLSGYVGWLEGNLLSFLTDEQAEFVFSNIAIHTVTDQEPESEADEDGAFY